MAGLIALSSITLYMVGFVRMMPVVLERRMSTDVCDICEVPWRWRDLSTSHIHLTTYGEGNPVPRGLVRDRHPVDILVAFLVSLVWPLYLAGRVLFSLGQLLADVRREDDEKECE